jgi:beta-phosphoglucomutase-like phosphatase (HAD superfamily)
MNLNPALDVAIRQAGYLLFAFDGPIRSADDGKPADSTASPAPYIYEVLAACGESGRSAAVISGDPLSDVRGYLDAHDLSSQITVVAHSISEAASRLETSLADCVFVTSSPADIEAAHVATTLAIGYAQTPGDADHLIEAGAIAFVYSMADLALTLRARSFLS